jgi:heme exporter protein D
MIWSSVHDFLRMGGYGLYVWGSFGVTALLMAIEVLLAHRRQHALLQELRHAGEHHALEDWQS